MFDIFQSKESKLLTLITESDTNINEIKKLIDKGVDIEARDSLGMTALMLAVSKGDTKKIELLIESHANVNAENYKNKTTLMYAAEKNYKEIVKLLVENGADVNAKDNALESVMIRVINNSNYELIKYFITHGSDLNEKYGFPKQSLLTYFTEENQLDIVTLLIKNGISYTKENLEYIMKKFFSTTSTSLYDLTDKEIEIAKFLLDVGVNLEQKERVSKQTPLMRAVSSGHIKLVELLLEYGANIEAKGGFSRKTPLMYAASDGQLSILKLLIEKNANLESRSEEKWTPLHFAVINNHKNIVNCLIEHHAKIDSTDKDNLSPLIWAATLGNNQVFEILFQKTKDPIFKKTINLITLNNGFELNFDSIFHNEEVTKIIYSIQKPEEINWQDRRLEIEEKLQLNDIKINKLSDSKIEIEFYSTFSTYQI